MDYMMPDFVRLLHKVPLMLAAGMYEQAQSEDDKIDSILGAAIRRHLSDGCEKIDKQRLAIEVLETALKIAKGEIKL